MKRKKAEREGFEPPLHERVNFISSEAHSARLCHLSVNSQKNNRKLSCLYQILKEQNLWNI